MDDYQSTPYMSNVLIIHIMTYLRMFSRGIHLKTIRWFETNLRMTRFEPTGHPDLDTIQRWLVSMQKYYTPKRGMYWQDNSKYGKLLVVGVGRGARKLAK
jgi:hypothetical protein